MSALRRIDKQSIEPLVTRIPFSAGPSSGAVQPGGRPNRCSEKRLRRKLSGTSGSNPSSSSGESRANLTSSSWRVSASIVRITQGEHRADERIASARFSCSDR